MKVGLTIRLGHNVTLVACVVISYSEMISVAVTGAVRTVVDMIVWKMVTGREVVMYSVSVTLTKTVAGIGHSKTKVSFVVSVGTGTGTGRPGRGGPGGGDTT